MKRVATAFVNSDDSSTESNNEQAYNIDHMIVIDHDTVENIAMETGNDIENAFDYNISVNNDENTTVDTDENLALNQAEPSPVPLEDAFERGYQNEQHQNCKDTSMKTQIAAWAVSCRVPHKSLRIILGILKNGGVDVPLDPRTLLKTPRINEIITLSYGKYQHYGIEKGIRNVLKDIKNLRTTSNVLNLEINIDDVPIDNIQSATVITGSLDQTKKVFLIGAFVPDRSEVKRLRALKHKTDQDEFLIFVVDELVALFYEGFEHENNHYVVMLDYLCADAPAKAKALKLKGHTGFYSCYKCYVKGENINNRTFFIDLKAKRRTDEEEQLKSKAVWKNVPQYRLVSDTILDYMHLAILGTTKKLLLFWTEGKKLQGLGANVTSAISKELKSLKKYTPTDFVRTIENLDFVAQWKATQFRQFLLYQGILVLKNNVPANIYKMFVYLSFGIRILCSKEKDLYSKANGFLKKFISMFIDIYGKEFCNHNINGLSHLYVDVLNHGPLDKFSAFKFENFMQLIKADVRKPGDILAQLSNRMTERENVSYVNNKKEYNRIKAGDEFPPLGCQSPQYKQYEFNGFKVNTEKLGDICFGTKSKEIIKIENVATNQFEKTVLIARKFNRRRPFLQSPINSADLGIFVVQDLSPLQIFNLDDIDVKYFMTPLRNRRFLVEPLIHSDADEY